MLLLHQLHPPQPQLQALHRQHRQPRQRHRHHQQLARHRQHRQQHHQHRQHQHLHQHRQHHRQPAVAHLVQQQPNMKTIIYDNNAVAISASNPLSVRVIGYNSSDSFSTTYTTADGTTAQTIKAATTDKSIYITDILFSSGTTMTFLLQDGSGTAVLYPVYTTANYPYDKTFSTPIKVTVSKALQIKTSAGGTFTLTFSGYVA